jgi:hypothetical protein
LLETRNHGEGEATMAHIRPTANQVAVVSGLDMLRARGVMLAACHEADRDWVVAAVEGDWPRLIQIAAEKEARRRGAEGRPTAARP